MNTMGSEMTPETLRALITLDIKHDKAVKLADHCFAWEADRKQLEAAETLLRDVLDNFDIAPNGARWIGKAEAFFSAKEDTNG